MVRLVNIGDVIITVVIKYDGKSPDAHSMDPPQPLLFAAGEELNSRPREWGFDFVDFRVAEVGDAVRDRFQEWRLIWGVYL